MSNYLYSWLYSNTLNITPSYMGYWANLFFITMLVNYNSANSRNWQAGQCSIVDIKVDFIQGWYIFQFNICVTVSEPLYFVGFKIKISCLKLPYNSLLLRCQYAALNVQCIKSRDFLTIGGSLTVHTESANWKLCCYSPPFAVRHHHPYLRPEIKVYISNYGNFK